MSRSRRKNSGGREPTLVITVSYPPLGQRGEYRVDPGVKALASGTPVVTSDKRGLALGTVIRGPHPRGDNAAQDKSLDGRNQLVRVATDNDLQVQNKAQQQQPQLMRKALRYIRDQELALRLVTLAVDGLGKKLIFCVLAEQEQDSDKVAAKLSRALGMTVELRQIGDRDQARVLGGVGRCGRPQCCSSHLDRYPKLSIKMAKNQGVSLSQERTSGNCGRTLCCLNYENSFYEAYHQYLPRISKRARTLDGMEGKVVGIDVLRQVFTLKDDTGRRHVLPAVAWEKNIGRELPEPELDQGSLAQQYRSSRLNVLHDASAPPNRDGAASTSQDSTSGTSGSPKPGKGNKRRRPKGRGQAQGPGTDKA